MTRLSLQRHRVSRLPEVDNDKSTKRKFTAYAIGYFHIDIAKCTNGGPSRL